MSRERPAAAVVVNLRREPFDVYIGRAGKGQDGYFGNPHALGLPCRTCSGRAMHPVVRHSPDECMALYRAYFAERVERDAEFRRRVLELRGKRLGCFCKPGPCHGDVIVEWLDSEGAPARQEEGGHAA